MAAATAICATVAASTRAAARRSGCPAASVRRLTRLTITRARPRKAKASTRCVQCSVAREEAGGSTPPSQSGKPRQRSPAWKLATCAPNRITTKPRAAVATTSPWAPCRASSRGMAGPSGAPARSATTISVASSSMALARWVMITQGGSASLTVTAPRSTCATRSTAASSAGFRRAGSFRWRRQPTRATAKTSRLTSAAAQRCPISIRVGRSSGGNHSPSQRGQ